MPVRTGTQPGHQARGLNRRKRDTTDEVLIPDGGTKLHHERDQTPDAQNTSNPVTRQAWRDTVGDQQDTDRRGDAVETFEQATGTGSRAGTDAGRNPPRRAAMRSNRANAPGTARRGGRQPVK